MKPALNIPPIKISLPKATSVFVVRHADKEASGADQLSIAGQARAEALAYLLFEDKVHAVFVTDTNRSRQTGSPVAAMSGISLTQYEDADDVINRITANHSGQRILVVAHSDTLKPIAFRLAGKLAVPASPLKESQFDRLYVVHLNKSGGSLARLRYGERTP